ERDEDALGQLASTVVERAGEQVTRFVEALASRDRKRVDELDGVQPHGGHRLQAGRFGRRGRDRELRRLLVRDEPVCRLIQAKGYWPGRHQHASTALDGDAVTIAVPVDEKSRAAARELKASRIQHV